MKKHYFYSTVFVATLLVFGSWAYADETDQFNDQIQALHSDRNRVEAQLGIGEQFDTYPHATCYYDDLEAHIEQVLISKDEIDKGIR